MNRQAKLFLFFAMVFICALIYAYFYYPQEKVFTGDVDMLIESDSSAKGPQAQNALTELKLDFGEQQKTKYTSPQRDIFAPLYTVRPVAKPKPIAKPQPVVKPQPVEKPKVVIGPSTPVAAPLARFDLLGYLDKGGERTVFLGQNKEIYLVKKGDSFAQEYRVADVTSEYMMINRINDNRGIRIDFKQPVQ